MTHRNYTKFASFKTTFELISVDYLSHFGRESEVRFFSHIIGIEVSDLVK